MNRSPTWIGLMVLGLALQPPPMGVAATKEAAPLTKNSRVSASKASPPETDAGQQDPVDFPRPPGLVRNSYSQTTGAYPSEEIATYHSKAGFDETVAPYLKDLQSAGWNKVSDSDYGSGINRVRMIEWHLPAKEAEIRFYGGKDGSSDLRVRIFTYKSTTKAAADAGPATATATQAAAVGATAKANATGAAPLGPPPTNIAVVCDGDAASHKISWDAKDWVNFDVLRETPDGWVTVAEKVTQTNAHESALVQPNTKFRVVARHTNGSEGSADYAWANPPHWATASVLQGNNHDTITITHNLGWPRREFGFKPPDGRYGWPGPPYVIDWTATTARVQLPSMPGVPQFNGNIEILHQQSEVIRIPFTWVPRFETQVMTLEETYLNDLSAVFNAKLPGSPVLPESLRHLAATTDSHVSGPGMQLNTSYIQYAVVGLFGDKGDDEFFTQLHLEPSWTVESVDIHTTVWLGKGDATIVASRVGTDSPYVKVHWWLDPMTTLSYSLRIKVKGPEGGQPLGWKVLPAR